MSDTDASRVFASGNTAIPYAAFNLRDDYYREMTRFLIAAVKRNLPTYAFEDGKSVGMIDLGCGIGISTMEILRAFPDLGDLVAIEPNDDMRGVCAINFMGDARVKVIKGKAETFSEDLAPHVPDLREPYFDVVIAAQMVPLLHPSVEKSLIPDMLNQARVVLRVGGVLAFDFGPSNFTFETLLADHRTGECATGAILTELAHPLYQRMHEYMLEIVRDEIDATCESLWPPLAARVDREWLKKECESYNYFENFTVQEDLSIIPGTRVIEFIRNGWTVFFRWGELSKLPIETKLSMVSRALGKLLAHDFDTYKYVTCYHPTAVITAVRRLPTPY